METYINLEEWYYNKKTKCMENHHTGEFISDKSEIIAFLSQAKDNIHRQKQLIKDAELELEVNKYLSENHIGWKTGGKTLFIKLYRTERREMLKDLNLSVNASALMLHLEGYIEFPTNRIAKPDKSDFTNQELMAMTKLGNVQLQNALKELEEKKVIKRTGKGKAREIYFNPFVSSAGNDMRKTTIKLFDKDYTPYTPY